MLELTVNSVLLIEVAKQFESYVNGDISLEDSINKVVDNLDYTYRRDGRVKKSNKIKQLKRVEKEKINKAEQEDIKKGKDITGLYFVLPSLIGVAIFTLLPFLECIYSSFSKCNF